VVAGVKKKLGKVKKKREGWENVKMGDLG